MSQIRVAQEGLVHGSHVDVYRFISDYKHHHPNFLPPAFSDLTVDRGGIGSGTELSFRLALGGQSRNMRVRVDEPEPGRVLSESDIDSDSVTTFTVEPSGQISRVTIETTWTPRGVRGVVERMLAPRMLRQLYTDELARLDRYAQEQLAVG